MVVKKHVKIIVAVLVLTLTLSVGSVFANGDPGQQLKIWYNLLFQQAADGVSGNVDLHRQQELKKIEIEKEQLVYEATSKLNETASDVSQVASETISLHIEEQTKQLLETRDTIINYTIDSDLQNYTEQKMAEIENELLNLLVEIIDELD